MTYIEYSKFLGENLTMYICFNINRSSSNDTNIVLHQVKTRYKIYMNYIMHRYYSYIFTCPSIFPSIHPTCHYRSEHPTNQLMTHWTTIHLSICTSFWEVLRMHRRNCLKFVLLMYPDKIGNSVDFVHAMGIFLILDKFYLWNRLNLGILGIVLRMHGWNGFRFGLKCSLIT